MTGRDLHGRFTPGNEYARRGGLARAAALSPARRRAIAKAGFAELARRHFDGRTRKAAAWLFDPMGIKQEKTR